MMGRKGQTDQHPPLAPLLLKMVETHAREAARLGHVGKDLTEG